MRDSHLKAHLHLSVEAEVFLRRERGTEQGDQGGGLLKSSLCADGHSPFNQASKGLVCVILDTRHPGYMSPWIHVTLAPQLKASESPRTGMPEGQSLYLLKLVPRILIQTCCSCTSYLLESALTETMSKEWWVGYNFPPLEFSTVTVWVRA